MPRRIMFVQLKTGHDIDRGPSWIGWVDFSKTWKTAYFQGRTLRRATGLGLCDANFYDVGSGEDFWISGPKRDRSDTRYGPEGPTVEEAAADAYRAFLQGAALPGRADG
ncbi:hypothetical protein [Streptomyces sp. NPDC048516]|uniref:hypothetical protein n=1 Tax=Streptomyces sp. NPDC048516 TaxID=3365565 RepID=UPI00372146AF